MRGCVNTHELGDARFVRACAAVDCALFDLGEYPLMARGDGRVAGELWEIAAEDLPRLDAFEGEAYRRETVTLDDGTRAFAYLGDVPPGARRIASGRWRPRAQGTPRKRLRRLF